MTLRIVSGLFKGRVLKSPKNMRPTLSSVRAAVFNICKDYIEKANFLDLFAGSGAIGLEAISRGALSATLVENSAKSLQCIRENICSLGVEKQVEVIRKDALAYLANTPKSFTIIYIDPPYMEKKLLEKCLIYLSEKPWIQEKGLLFIEEGEKNSHRLANLTLYDQKKFGDSFLSIFQKK